MEATLDDAGINIIPGGIKCHEGCVGIHTQGIHKLRMEWLKLLFTEG